MKPIYSVMLSMLSIGLSACASKDKPCEEILEVKHQIQQCEQWRKIMINNNYPQQAMTAKKRYEQECQDLRYYRDDYDTICKGNETPIGENKAEH
tara:strand:+ start:6453 stop:6737 length:285 start_codon:yes stop_codon:yes gene_type:complete